MNIVLTPREYQVVQAMSEGLSNEEIAEEIGISSLTVRDHIKNAKEKSDATGRYGERILFANYSAGRYVTK